jgi:N-acetyl-gamma-glutamyl-phosphate reductase
MAYKVFIDGEAGTTGLHLRHRLLGREDIRLLEIAAAERKNNERRRELTNEADVVFLCLPDQAAREAVAFCENEHTIIIDASTAHRIAEGWAYGLPELSAAHRHALAGARRIANPGCYATGANCILYPLVARGVLPTDYPVVIHALSGYSGGGKKLISAYEAMDRPAELSFPRPYALGLGHKHIPEIQRISGLVSPPLFNPVVCDFYAGMSVSVPLYASLLKGRLSTEEIFTIMSDYYAREKFISVCQAPEADSLRITENTGSNNLTIYVCGNDQQITLTSILDNLGKGASGAAVQNMNVALGLEETLSLRR